ncbi:hypothetical protein [Deinococcus sp. NW-56]|uniref:hypothetical protein n=1 Tax=Deinococcus sp. NW-56 TaxID=2080419 RepID=UPI000CF3D756|nr:hypothetical protein [Deinococcus sp. NW-56]
MPTFQPSRTPASRRTRPPSFLEAMGLEATYLLGRLVEGVQMVGSCTRGALHDMARPLTRVLLLALPALLATLWLPAETGQALRLGLLLTALVVLAGQFLVNVIRRWKFRAYSYYRR